MSFTPRPAAGLAASIVGAVLIAAGAAALNAEGTSVASADSLATAGRVDTRYIALGAPLHSVSQLCRIPIEIGLWNTPQPGRCV